MDHKVLASRQVPLFVRWTVPAFLSVDIISSTTRLLKLAGRRTSCSTSCHVSILRASTRRSGEHKTTSSPLSCVCAASELP